MKENSIKRKTIDYEGEQIFLNICRYENNPKGFMKELSDKMVIVDDKEEMIEEDWDEEEWEE